MNFDELIEFLEKRIELPLPGRMAHDSMMPKLANGTPIRIQHQTPPKDSAVMILLHEREGVPYFPLIQRPTYEGVHSGQVGLPGGRKELVDVSLVDTALRETEEEIGVGKDKVEVLGNLSPFYVVASNYNVLPVVGFLKEEPVFTPDRREVEEIINPSIGELINAETKKEKEVIARGGIKLQSPYFDLLGKTVWGATAMMLNEFVSILQEFSTE